MEHSVILSFVFLNLFMILGAVDLFYFHLWKYKLHTRPESRFEHKLHMAFAFLMVPVAGLLYYQNFGGYALWAGVVFVVAALLTELADVVPENDSRESLGGLSTGEYALQVILTILKVSAFAFIFGSKPIDAWSLSSPLVLGTYGSMGELIAIKVMAGSFLVGLLHIVLLNKRFADLVSCDRIGRFIGCRTFSCCSK